jgi:hypothetical protein
MPWKPISDRSMNLPADWETRRRRCLADAGGRCQAFDPATRKRCANEATQADHKGDPMDHGDLQALCWYHHDRKTNAESVAARARQQAKLRHPMDVHPALRNR